MDIRPGTDMAAGNSPTFRDHGGADQTAQERFFQAAPVTRPLNDGLNGKSHAAAAINDADAQMSPSAAENRVLEERGMQPQNEVIAMDGKRDYTDNENLYRQNEELARERLETVPLQNGEAWSKIALEGDTEVASTIYDAFIDNLKNQDELSKNYFDILSDKGSILGGRSGEEAPLMADSNSFYKTYAGHIITYNSKGEKALDISDKRIKIWKKNINYSNPSQVNWSNYKLKNNMGRVDKTFQWILDYFNL